MPRNIRPLCCPRKLAALVGFLFLTGVLNLLGCGVANRAAPTDGNCRVVERVIDGDTLVMDNGERVRLVGVDTPESKHPNKPLERFGKEAAGFTRRNGESKRMRLEFERQMHPGAQGQHATEAHVWLTCFSTPRLLSRAIASLTRAFLFIGWRSLGG